MLPQDGDQRRAARVSKGSGLMNGMFTLRELVWKRLEVQGEMALGFVDQEKAHDTIPREMVMATLRWMGVPEAEVRLVEGMYKETKGRVLVGPGMSEEFMVNIILRQGSALSPIMFIMVMELVSRRVNMKGVLGRMLYAVDLAVVVERRLEMQEVLAEWKKAFEKHGLRMRMEKTGDVGQAAK